MHKVLFYTLNKESSPVSKYLDSCNSIIRAKILTQIKYIQEFGLTSKIPNLRKLTGTPFWELRILGRDNIRIICVSIPNKEVVILHVFTKKKQKTPLREISTAITRFRSLTSDI